MNRGFFIPVNGIFVVQFSTSKVLCGKPSLPENTSVLCRMNVTIPCIYIVNARKSTIILIFSSLVIGYWLEVTICNASPYMIEYVFVHFHFVDFFIYFVTWLNYCCIVFVIFGYWLGGHLILLSIMYTL